MNYFDNLLIVSVIKIRFGLVVGQKKHFKGITLGSRKLDENSVIIIVIRLLAE